MSTKVTEDKTLAVIYEHFCSLLMFSYLLPFLRY